MVSAIFHTFFGKGVMSENVPRSPGLLISTYSLTAAKGSWAENVCLSCCPVGKDEDYEKPLDKLGKYFVLSHVLYITTPIHFICILLFLYILISLPKFDGIEAWKKYIYIYTLCVVVE
jgi:hypothetical protein